MYNKKYNYNLVGPDAGHALTAVKTGVQVHVVLQTYKVLSKVIKMLENSNQKAHDWQTLVQFSTQWPQHVANTRAINN